jgi:hypothetical protein
MLDHPGRKMEHWLELLYGTMVSYLPTANHVPFLRVYIWTLIEYLKPRCKQGRFYHMGLTGGSYSKMSGDVVEADDETWNAFTDFYGLDEVDESYFAGLISKTLIKYGLPCVIDSDYVYQLFKKDTEIYAC